MLSEEDELLKHRNCTIQSVGEIVKIQVPKGQKLTVFVLVYDYYIYIDIFLCCNGSNCHKLG